MADHPSRYQFVRLEADLLSSAQRAELEAHLVSCADCQAVMAGIQANTTHIDESYDRHFADLKVRLARELERGDNVVSLTARQRSNRTLAVVGGFAAIAAAAVLGVFMVLRQAQGPLPSYELEASSGELAVRGDEPRPATLRLAQGTSLELVARPSAPVEGPLEAAAFVLTKQGAARLDAAIELDADGAVRLVGIVGQSLTLPSDTMSIWLVVGRKGALPDPEALAAAVGNRSIVHAEGYVALGQTVEPKAP